MELLPGVWGDFPPWKGNFVYCFSHIKEFPGSLLKVASYRMIISFQRLPGSLWLRAHNHFLIVLGFTASRLDILICLYLQNDSFKTKCSVYLAFRESADIGTVLLSQSELPVVVHGKVCAYFYWVKISNNNLTATTSVIPLSPGAEIWTFLFPGREVHPRELTFSEHHDKWHTPGLSVKSIDCWLGASLPSWPVTERHWSGFCTRSAQPDFRRQCSLVEGMVGF